MSYSDEDLDRLFRSLRPQNNGPSAGLDAPTIALRESIIRGSYKVARRPRKRLLWAGLTAAATATVAAVVAVATVMAPTPAVALTPPPLQYSPAGSVEDVLEEAEQDLRAEPDIPQTSTVRSVTWGWNVEMASKHVEIVPQENSFTWSVEGGSTSTTYAGDSYWSDNERPEGVDPGPYERGELIEEVVTPADDFTLPEDAATLSGSSTAELQRALNVFGATPASSSGELLAAITGLLQYWTLNDEQHAVLLRLLYEAGDLTVLGETTDRLGRDVIGVQVSQVIPERQETLFIAVDTGRIVGIESELVKPLEGLPLGVILYTMWDAP